MERLIDRLSQLESELSKQRGRNSQVAMNMNVLQQGSFIMELCEHEEYLFITSMLYITAVLQVGRSQQAAERRLQELQVLKKFC